MTAIYAADIVSPEGYVWFAFFGAAGASILVYFIAQFGGGGATPVKLALAGVVITALLGGWTTSLLILDLETLDEARFWLAGSIASRGTDEIAVLFPVIVIALFLGISLGKQINILSLGEDIAISLGQRITTYPNSSRNSHHSSLRFRSSYCWTDSIRRLSYSTYGPLTWLAQTIDGFFI